MLTGQSFYRLREGAQNWSILDRSFKVYPGILEAAGYHVGYTGKGWGPGDWERGGWTRNPAGLEYNQRQQKPVAGLMREDDYDRDLTDIFAIQSHVAQQIAAALKATLTPEEEIYIEEKPTDNPEAYEYYLRGNVFFNLSGQLGNAIGMYKKVVELDPTFALAYARLSRSHIGIYWWDDRSPERLAMVKSALDRA